MSTGERWLRFVHLRPFEADWKRLRLRDEDLRELELAIMQRPEGAPVISGTGSVRKARFASRRGGKGKRGSVRVGYCHFPRFGLVALMAAYGKNEKGDLTPMRRSDSKAWSKNWSVNLRRGESDETTNDGTQIEEECPSPVIWIADDCGADGTAGHAAGG